MKSYCFNSNIKIITYRDNNLMIQFSISKNVLLFNCCESCQYLIVSNKYKINNISKIILVNMHVKNLSGLVGFLSSLNLIGRIKSLHIYGPSDLVYYLELNKKYSHTNFNYNIYVHVLTSGLIINDFNYKIYSIISNRQYNFLVVEQEKVGTFLVSKAQSNGLVPNSLYGKLKKGLIFMLPDGYLLDGNCFTLITSQGCQIPYVLDEYCRRNGVEVFMKLKTIFF
uniref:Ribonuclease Z n=1 Tax=Caloglossa monosticha TaxID=76906 RepID=A0A1Z1M595_9FLOR|nr:ribonuclease Z [Caloglossa monosticha]ARW60965.1 ribonuclease Z [Caloglossa monosticha]